ncbi:hypothetical protein BDB01DRAFT_848660 [Pilobolus umbonatus]|nr:hypothetical protein BDB01DRAFT_848660 [Pilobolus umbonatus]
MEQAAGPCQDAALALTNDLKKHRELLPHTITYEGKKVPMTMDRLSREYPGISKYYLLDLLQRFLDHFKDTGDPKKLRVNALRHGDNSLLTMLSAFVSHPETECSNYLCMNQPQLEKLSIHRLLIAREMGANILKKNQMPTAISTCYRERVTISGHRNPVYCVVFDKTNRRLFTGSDDFLVKVWCVRTGYLIHTIRGHQNIITDIAINQENTLIATASSDGCVRVWTMDEYKPIMCLRTNATTIKPFTTVKFSPSPRSETRYLLATNEDGLVRLWRWDKENLQFYDIDSPVTFSCKFRAKDRLRCSSFNYTGTKFAVAGDDGFVYVFSTIQVKVTHAGITTQTDTVSHDNKPPGRGRRRVASALFPDKSGQGQSQPVVPIGTLEGHMGSVTDLAFSHDGQRILSGCQDGTARIWMFDKVKKEWSSIKLDVKENSDVAQIRPQTTPITNSMDSNTVLEESSENEFGTFMPPIEDIEDTSPTSDPTTSVEQPTNHTNPIMPVEQPRVSMIAWSSDDKWCFAATSHGEIRVYYSYNGELACILKGHEGEIYALDNHPLDPSTILSAGYDGNVILWDVGRKAVIKCTKHVGRTFTDCKFSKDAMKYAITDEEGHCTLYGIGGLHKDYEQVRNWERGQYFISDYQALRHLPDGTFLDEPTQQEPYQLSYSPIIDLQGVAYPSQKKLGYGRNIPVIPETFEQENLKRAACYAMEEEEIRSIKNIVLPVIDRATIAKKRREFVKQDDDEDNDNNMGTQIQFFPPSVQPFLLPDDSADEDYHDDEPGNAAYISSGQSSDEGGSDEFENMEDNNQSDADHDDERPVTRSRAGQLRNSHSPTRSLSRSNDSSSFNNTRRSTNNRKVRRGRGGRGSVGGISTRSNLASRPTRKRNRESSYDDENDLPVRPRTRKRDIHFSYHETDDEEITDKEDYLDIEKESEAEYSDSSEDLPTNHRNELSNGNAYNGSHYHYQDEAQTSLASSSSSTIVYNTRKSHQQQPEIEDRKGKRKLRSTSFENDEYASEISSPKKQSNGSLPSQSTATGVRFTRNRLVQNESSKPVVVKSAKNSIKKGIPRSLSEEEIKLYEPIPWIRNVEESFSKYLPQMSDRVAILTEGHRQYLKTSEMKELFDEKHGVIDKYHPVLFAEVTGISWQVGPPAFCKLKLDMLDIPNIQQVLNGKEAPRWRSLDREQVIDYSDEDGCPEFIVLWEKFLASMDIFRTLTAGKKVEAIYDDGKYTGTVSRCNDKGLKWEQANLPSPWAYYHVIWDDNSSPPEDLCPWELVPRGENFHERYDVEPRLTAQEIQRAKDIIQWLSGDKDFQLYVHQVDYYEYPAYLSMIAYPICLDMISKRLENNFYRSKEGLIDDFELIRKNAQKYNADTSSAYKNSVRLANFFKSRLLNLHMPLGFSRGGRRKAVLPESDDEYHEEVQRDESEEEPDPRDVMDADNSDDDCYIDDDDDDNY